MACKWRGGHHAAAARGAATSSVCLLWCAEAYKAAAEQLAQSIKGPVGAFVSQGHASMRLRLGALGCDVPHSPLRLPVSQPLGGGVCHSGGNRDKVEVRQAEWKRDGQKL